jgi:hypothetical protein
MKIHTNPKEKKMAKNSFGIGMLVMVLAFGMTVIGCDTGTNGGGGFVPVTDITNLPVIALQGVSLSLSGTVEPANATNTTISWSGANVSGGVFTATSTGASNVTATIVNGASESSNYTKTFSITTWPDSNPISLAQGTWTRDVVQEGTTYTLKMTITGNTWQISASPPGLSEIPLDKGYIVNVDAGTSTYASQETHKYEGGWVPHTHYETGTYALSNGNNTLSLASPNPDSKAAGTWARQL